MYVKLSRFQSGKKSFSRPWSPPSQEPLSVLISTSLSNVSADGVATNMPELKQSGHPESGAALKSAARLKRCDRGWRQSVSASRKMTLRNWTRRKRCSLVNVDARS